MVNTAWATGKWKELKGKARQKWGALTDDDLDRVKGKRDELAGLIQQRYGKEREAVEKELAEWEKEVGLR